MRRRDRVFGRRRHRWTGVAVVAAVALLVGGGFVLWTVWDLLTPPAQVFAEQLERDPDLPVLVPAELPVGYVFLGPGRRLADADGITSVATWRYGPKPVTSRDAPIVEVCVSRRGRGLATTCAIGGQEPLLVASDRGLDAVVTPLAAEVPDEVRSSWAMVELTRRWDEVAWARRRPLFG